MSYAHAHSLRAFESDATYPSGTQVVGGFQVVGLQSANAGGAVQRLREAVASAFPMGSVAPTAQSGPNRGRATSGWGAAFGVPSGRLYVVIQTNVDGVTGPQINAALAQVARSLSSRLNGLRVNLTNAHAAGGAAPLPALTPDVDQGGNTLPGGTGLSPLAIGGIAVGGLVLVAAGVAAFSMLRRPVMRNRRRRLRRNERMRRNAKYGPNYGGESCLKVAVYEALRSRLPKTLSPWTRKGNEYCAHTTFAQGDKIDDLVVEYSKRQPGRSR